MTLVKRRTPRNYRAESPGLTGIPACLEKFIPPPQLLTPLTRLVPRRLTETRPCMLTWLTFIQRFVVLSTALPLPKTLTALKLRPKLRVRLPTLRVGAIPR